MAGHRADRVGLEGAAVSRKAGDVSTRPEGSARSEPPDSKRRGLPECSRSALCQTELEYPIPGGI